MALTQILCYTGVLSPFSGRCLASDILLRSNDSNSSSSIALYSFDTGAASTLVQRHGITDNGRSFRIAFLCGAVGSTTKATVVTVVLRVEVLAREVARRGWNFADLAHAAGISSATVTAARAGRPVSPKTLRSIATALASAPSLDGVDELLLG